MSTPTHPRLLKQLSEAPWEFSFYQTVRLLLKGRAAAPGGGVPSALIAGEFVRFISHVSMAFPPSDVARVNLPPSGSGPAEVVQALIGLAGAHGPLPDHYTERLILLTQQRDHALREFLNIFEQRLVVLFYGAWERSRFFLQAERGEVDVLTRILLALLGLESASGRQALPFSASHLLAHSLSVSRRPVPAEVALGVVRRFLGHVPASLCPFQPKWIEIEERSRLRLASGAERSVLGQGCVLGKRYLDIQGQVLLKLGPMSAADYLKLIPEGPQGRELKALFAWLCGSQFETVTELVLRAGEMGGVRLGRSADGRGRVGQSAWLGAPDPSRQLVVNFGGGAVRRSWSMDAG